MPAHFCRLRASAVSSKRQDRRGDNVNEITVREYGRLTTADIKSTLDEAQVSPSAFQWVCRVSENLSASGAALVQIEGRQWLRLDNYVGVIETPCGTRIEILPKYLDAGDDVSRARHLLIRMLERALGLPDREVGPAVLHTFKAPLGELAHGPLP